MPRSRFLAPVLAAAVAAALTPLLLDTGPATDAQANAPSRPLRGFLDSRCPTVPMRRLPGDAVAGATRAALAQAPAAYRGVNLHGVRVTQASLARVERGGSGEFALSHCGLRAQNRTVVVDLEFPAMRPSASLSQGRVLVARFADGYRIWALLH